MNNNTSANQKKYPWYDDRVELLRENNQTKSPDWFDTQPLENLKNETYSTPKEIYTYLNQYVWKQDAAKRAAALVAYQSLLRNIKSNTIFVGPTGCGKTHIWRCLKRLFPDRIEIVDGSNLSLDGWKGEKKWSSLLLSPIFRTENSHTILVIDEVDKMLSPKFASGGENVSQSIQSEGLAMMEGSLVNVKEDKCTYEIDTSRISFVLCGAFSSKAAAVAAKEGGSRLGFGSVQKEAKAYDRPLAEADLLEFGVMPEFMGRMQRIVSLEPMTVDDYYKITDSPSGPLEHIRKQYGAEVTLSPRTRRMLAEEACTNGLGIRGMENRIRTLLDEALFEDCNKRRFDF